MKTSTTLSLAFAFVFALTLAASAGEGKPDPSKLPPASTKTGVTYDADIKPIFEKSCVKCHGAEKPKSKLNLSTLEGALKGSKDGKVIIPGKSGESDLVFSVAHVGDDSDMFMPPPESKSKIAPLTKEQVGLIRAWIDQGAK
jgi:mono/diheme cytochrome c family protein